MPFDSIQGLVAPETSRFQPQSLKVLSQLPESARWPSGLKPTAATPSVCPVRIAWHCWVSRSQSRSVLSQLPESADRPSGLKPTEVIPSVCPVRVARHLWVSRSQSRSVLSELPESADRPSGLKSMAVTPSVCPSKVARYFIAEELCSPDTSSIGSGSVSSAAS